MNSRKYNSLKAFLFSVLMLVLIGLIAYTGLNKYNRYERNKINQNLGLIVGEIKSKHSYKGKGVSVEYNVKGRKYNIRTGVSSEFYENVEVGSRVSIKYDTLNPELILLEE